MWRPAVLKIIIISCIWVSCMGSKERNKILSQAREQRRGRKLFMRRMWSSTDRKIQKNLSLKRSITFYQKLAKKQKRMFNPVNIHFSLEPQSIRMPTSIPLQPKIEKSTQQISQIALEERKTWASRTKIPTVGVVIWSLKLTRLEIASNRNATSWVKDQLAESNRYPRWRIASSANPSKWCKAAPCTETILAGESSLNQKAFCQISALGSKS